MPVFQAAAVQMAATPDRDANLAVAERLVRERASHEGLDLDRQAVETQLTQALGTRVRLKQRKKGAGRIEIEYYSLDELNGLIDRLGALERAERARGF